MLSKLVGSTCGNFSVITWINVMYMMYIKLASGKGKLTLKHSF